MHNIDQARISDDFAECHRAAVDHINRCAGEPLKSWLRSTPAPLSPEHLSFRLGNQLFFVNLTDAGGGLRIPGSLELLFRVAEGCGGHACLMPMRRHGATWQAESGGWGLIDARTGRPVDPPSLVSEERIEMTDWELQGFAVQVVCTYLKQSGRKLAGAQSDPSVTPSIWFEGEDGLEWVVVRATRYPEAEAARPDNLDQIADFCRRTGKSGHFASVAVASAEQFASADAGPDPVPLWRGHGMIVSFPGLECVTGAT